MVHNMHVTSCRSAIRCCLSVITSSNIINCAARGKSCNAEQSVVMNPYVWWHFWRNTLLQSSLIYLCLLLVKMIEIIFWKNYSHNNQYVHVILRDFLYFIDLIEEITLEEIHNRYINCKKTLNMNKISLSCVTIKIANIIRSMLSRGL